MTLQKRLKRIMRRRDMRVADLARALEAPYTTVREWVLNGRDTTQRIERKLKSLEAAR